MKIAVLLSGGVDSSIALAKVLQSPENKNATIEAFYLKIWLEDELSYLGDCPWEEDLSYARSVCNQFNVPLNIVNLQQEYYQKVVTYIISELKKGNTPSPDIFCNERIKFGVFLEKFQNYDQIISGHYAIIEQKGNNYTLKQAKDPIKDQSYFLSHLNQKQLSKISFPLGNFLKKEVREEAQKLNLANKDRPDSQGICFLGKFKYEDFVKEYLGEKEGNIVNLANGKILGKHKGFWFYTIGQRKGIGLSGGPWFIANKDTENNIVYILHEEDYERQDEQEFYGCDPHWILEEKPDFTLNFSLKLRHGPNKVDCTLKESENGLIQVKMNTPDRGIAPGQFAIIYQNDTCLGSLKIHSRILNK